MSAAAGDEIIGRDPFALAGREIVHRRDHAVVVLLERFEPAAQPQRHAGKARGPIAQDRVKPELIAALRPFRADGARRAAAVTGPLDARNFKAGECREIENGVRDSPRRAGLAHPVGDAPAPEELHGARVFGVGARMRDGAVALLDQQALDAAPAEIGRKAEADRPASDDQDRSVGIACHRLFSTPVMTLDRLHAEEHCDAFHQHGRLRCAAEDEARK